MHVPNHNKNKVYVRTDCVQLFFYRIYFIRCRFLFLRCASLYVWNASLYAINHVSCVSVWRLHKHPNIEVHTYVLNRWRLTCRNRSPQKLVDSFDVFIAWHERWVAWKIWYYDEWFQNDWQTMWNENGSWNCSDFEWNERQRQRQKRDEMKIKNTKFSASYE